MLKVTQLYGFGGGSSRPLAFQSVSSYNGSSASSHSITMPTTFQVGDLLLINVRCSGTVSSFTGWTEITTGGAATNKVYRKIAVGSDTASIVLTGSATLEASIASYGATTGIDGTPTGDYGTAGSDAVMGAITVTTAGGLLIATGSLPGGGSIGTPAGFTQDASVTPSSVLFKFYSKAIAATGSTGTVTLTQSLSNAILGGLIYIKP